MASNGRTGKETTRQSLAVFDAEQLVEAVAASDLTHVQVSSGRFRGRLVGAQLDRCRLDAGRYNQTLISRGAFPRGHVVIGCLLDARQPGCINGYRFGRFDVVLFPDGAELDYLVPADTVWTALQIPRALFEESWPVQARDSGVCVYAGSRPVNATLARRLKHLLYAPEPPLAAASDTGRCDRERSESVLLDQVCRVLSEADTEPCPRPPYATRTALVRRFEDIVEGNAYRDLSVAKVAGQLQVSQRTLEHCFKQYLGVSPVQYLTRLRLNAIHRALMRSSEDSATVEAVAGAHGVTHLGRFADRYRRHFGFYPSETLRRRRS